MLNIEDDIGLTVRISNVISSNPILDPSTLCAANIFRSLLESGSDSSDVIWLSSVVTGGREWRLT
jgi:hypothetical protein